MKIYITDLQAYNEGYLVGNWYTLPMSEDELAEAIENELQRGRFECNQDIEELETIPHHEEYFITDYECDYMDIGEYDSIYNLNNIAQQMEELDEDEQTAVKLMLENYIVKDITEAIENIENMHCTNENKMEDIAYQYIEDTGALKDIGNLSFYFDYEALGRDMDMNGSYYEADDGIIWEYVA